MFSTYIIQSLSHDIYNIGHTNNHKDRLKRDNSNRNKFTENKGPWELVFHREFVTRKEAISFERKLKSFKNKKYLLKCIERHGLFWPSVDTMIAKEALETFLKNLQ